MSNNAFKGTSLIKMAAYIIGLDTFSSGVTVIKFNNILQFC